MPCRGQLLFAFGRLEFNLVLHLASFGDPAAYEARRIHIEAGNFASKLERLRLLAQDPRLVATARAAYEQWGGQANEMRLLRNRLAHGRWGFEHMNRTVVNVGKRAIPAEDDVVAFTLDDLRSHVEAVSTLGRALWGLRQHWGLIDTRSVGTTGTG